MSVKLTPFAALIVVAILQQGCLSYRVAKVPIKYAAHRAALARAEKRGERRGEERAMEQAAAPRRIDSPTPVDVPAN